DLEARRQQRVQERLVQVVAEAADLACAGHLHAQYRVGAHQPREGEHGCLDPVALEAKGKLRDARRLHSMTLTALSLARYCTLKGPVMRSALAGAWAILRAWRMVAM